MILPWGRQPLPFYSTPLTLLFLSFSRSGPLSPFVCLSLILCLSLARAHTHAHMYRIPFSNSLPSAVQLPLPKG